ncbi:CinA family protein [Roseovarius sp. 217]|uniref:CinA family protein n=1 Tax=Roseovarius sp. (strain 217) TaxID=314264 RepID=UPI0000685B54|nr:CinA family protein [Roseovarius sp. 217]EAQ26941.1 competence/damage-inducible protein CinA domain protein [Roseovarius sp. 217]
MITQDILDRARHLGLMIVTAESCTGGMVAAALTEIPGSSAVVERGFVTYSNISKIEMLDVSQVTLETHGAVSEQVAREMAEGALAHSAAQLAISITGIAGPGDSERKPEGRVCFGLAMTGRQTVTETLDFGPLGRKTVRERARDHALNLVLSYLSQ